jgi:hypothetical protein
MQKGLSLKKTVSSAVSNVFVYENIVSSCLPDQDEPNLASPIYRPDH